jgi:hypothetical protein
MSIYNQRDLVWLNDPAILPDGTELDHPVLIISCSAANSRENHYTAVMMTASSHTDLFSFKLHNTMFESPLAKEGCQIRMYILLSIRQVKIKKMVNRMKKIDFENLTKQIKEYVLAID